MSARMRCLVAGCNPVLDETSAASHKEETGAAGIKKAKARNRSGYYDKYNVGDKAAEYSDSIHPFSEEAFE